MTKTEIRQQVLELPEAERLEIADAIWSSLDDPDTLPLPQWQRDLLDERLARRTQMSRSPVART